MQIFRAPKRQEVGAGLIVIVLLAMLMLAALLVISANLSLSARRSTSEQKAILPAQYAAESGISYARSLLGASQALMANSLLPTAGGGVTYGTMKSWIASLCPTTVTVPVPGYNPATAPSTVIPTTVVGGNPGISVPNSVLICDLSNTTFTEPQANFFAQVIPNAGTALLTYAQNGIPVDDAGRRNFFYRVFSSNNSIVVNGASVKAGLRPVALLQINSFQYAFYFRVAGVDSLGSTLASSVDSGSKRRITVEGNDTLHGFAFTFAVPSLTTGGTAGTNPLFSAYGQFVNIWGSRAGSYGYGNDFSGPFHTNEIPSLRGTAAATGVMAGTSITINGALSSTGCGNVVTTIDGLGNRTDACTGGRYNGIVSNVSGGTETRISGSAMTNAGPQTMADGFGVSHPYTMYGSTNGGDSPLFVAVQADNPIPNPLPNFNSDFINMPVNSNNQRDLAQTAGILTDNPQKVQFSISGSGSTKYQVIEIVPSAAQGGNLSLPVRFRFNSTKVLQIESPAGSGAYTNAAKNATAATGWAPAPVGAAPTTFNGMIYANGDIGSLSGPARSSASVTSANGSAAIADFAGITVTAEKNATITGDIKYETRCLTINACVTKTGNEYNVKNIFGLYSATGDVRIAYNPTTRNQNTAPGSAANAPANLEIDGFVMAGRGHITPYSFGTGNSGQSALSESCGSACNRGKFIVHGGTIKDTDDIVKFNSTGWSENYYFDARGTDYSPPGFPTTTVGTAGTAGTLIPPTDASLVTAWGGSLGKTNPDGTQNSTNDFSLSNELRQGTNQ